MCFLFGEVRIHHLNLQSVNQNIRYIVISITIILHHPTESPIGLEKEDQYGILCIPLDIEMLECVSDPLGVQRTNFW